MSLLIDALSGKNLSRPPIWLMRQAGRYMPSYQALRKQYSLGDLFRNSDLIAKVTLLPIEEFQFDAAIIFSDILLLLETLGCNVHYPAHGAPWVEWNHSFDLVNGFSLEKAIDHLKNLGYLFEGIAQVKKKLPVPLFGFSAAPFTLLCYLLDKEDRKTFPNTFALLKQNPLLFKKLLDQLCILIIEYAQLQLQSGADVFQIFESCGSVLSKEQFKDLSLPYLEKISKSLPTPCISFIKGACKHIELLQTSSLSAMSFDAEIPMKSIRDQVGKEKILQGNLDPQLLLQPKEIIKKETKSLLLSMQNDPRFILNLGHGILPQTPYENVTILMETVRNF